MMKRYPTYLRVVATTKCPMACTFCHMEGDPQASDSRWGLPLNELVQCLRVAAKAGIRKFKFLGGEPLIRKDLPEAVTALRRAAPDADISVITAGAGPASQMQALFDAGLDRANLSIHGWGEAAFSGMRTGYHVLKQDLTFEIFSPPKHEEVSNEKSKKTEKNPRFLA